MTAVIEADLTNGVQLEREALPSGKEVWVARDLNLDGCLAQADSKEEALAALEQARLEYRSAIRHLASRTPASVPVAQHLPMNGQVWTASL
jgi:predicted RNase H-like HicB family nuclease